jgi:hypothetical protein
MTSLFPGLGKRRAEGLHGSSGSGRPSFSLQKEKETKRNDLSFSAVREKKNGELARLPGEHLAPIEMFRSTNWGLSANHRLCYYYPCC